MKAAPSTWCARRCARCCARKKAGDTATALREALARSHGAPRHERSAASLLHAGISAGRASLPTRDWWTRRRATATPIAREILHSAAQGAGDLWWRPCAGSYFIAARPRISYIGGVFRSEILRERFPRWSNSKMKLHDSSAGLRPRRGSADRGVPAWLDLTSRTARCAARSIGAESWNPYRISSTRIA